MVAEDVVVGSTKFVRSRYLSVWLRVYIYLLMVCGDGLASIVLFR